MKTLKTIGSILGGLFVFLNFGATSGKVEAAVGPPRIENITAMTPLYLTHAQSRVDDANVLAWHSSHESHASHYSHESHSSHYSHRSGW